MNRYAEKIVSTIFLILMSLVTWYLITWSFVFIANSEQQRMLIAALVIWIIVFSLSILSRVLNGMMLPSYITLLVAAYVITGYIPHLPVIFALAGVGFALGGFQFARKRST